MTPLQNSAVVEYLRSLYKGDFAEVDGQVTVETVATRIVKSDPEAVALTLVNLGVNDIFLTPSNLPSSTNGILIAGNGGSVSMQVPDDYTLPSKEWYGIAPDGATALYYVRVKRYIVTG